MSDAFIVRPECPICGIDSTSVDTVKTIHPESDMVMEIRECKNCGHWWIHPLPAQGYLDSLYRSHSKYVVPGDYGCLDEKEIRKAGNIPPRDYRRLQKAYGNREKGTRCLEIGVGAGTFHIFLMDQGYDCHGIDPGNWNPSLRLFDDVESLPYRDYQMFFLFDVLEHLQDPVDLLSRLRERAANGASLYCRFPNKDSVPARLYKGKWAMVRPLGHLHYFSKKSASLLLRAAGWIPLEITPVNAHHNRWYSSFHPFEIGRKLLTPHRYWKDQFRVHGTAV